MSNQIFDDSFEEANESDNVPNDLVIAEPVAEPSLEEVVADMAQYTDDEDQQIPEFAEVVGPIPEPSRSFDDTALVSALKQIHSILQVSTEVRISVDTSLGSLEGESIKDPTLQQLFKDVADVVKASSEAQIYLKVKNHIFDIGRVLSYLDKSGITVEDFVTNVGNITKHASANPAN